MQVSTQAAQATHIGSLYCAQLFHLRAMIDVARGAVIAIGAARRGVARYTSRCTATAAAANEVLQGLDELQVAVRVAGAAAATQPVSWSSACTCSKLPPAPLFQLPAGGRGPPSCPRSRSTTSTQCPRGDRGDHGDPARQSSGAHGRSIQHGHRRLRGSMSGGTKPLVRRRCGSAQRAAAHRGGGWQRSRRPQVKRGRLHSR